MRYSAPDIGQESAQWRAMLRATKIF
ncbi:hypothetical protein IL54_1111 [Sphingobium sp. ba1]|nr:hypothetical protein IL54_1111 [Sphingobium sp. ba1]